MDTFFLEDAGWLVHSLEGCMTSSGVKNEIKYYLSFPEVNKAQLVAHQSFILCVTEHLQHHF